MTLIDIGFNFTNEAFRRDEAAVLERAADNGVSRMIVTGTDIAQSEAASRLVERYPEQLYATAGVHPHHAKDFRDHDTARLADLLARPGTVAVGETGLDYNRNFSAPEDQRRCLEAQLELAAELRLPVFLHERDAHLDLLAIVSRFRNRLPAAVVHCFTGGTEELAAYLDLDLHVGITGWVCDERRGDALRAAVPAIPAERLMIETDAPYLLPRDLVPRPRDRRNEPMYLPHVLDAIAALRGEEPESLADRVTATTERFFDLEDAP